MRTFLRRMMAMLTAAMLLAAPGVTAALAEESVLDLTGRSFANIEDLRAAVDASDAVTVDLTDVPLSLEDRKALIAAYPDRHFRWTLDVFGRKVSSEDTVLDFGSSKVKDFDKLADYLACLPRMEQVLMYESNMNIEDRDKLFYAFPDIFFGFTLQFQDNGYRIRSDVTAFSTLKNGAPPYLYNRHLWWVKYCRNLKGLDLGHNAITDLSFLYEAPKLKVLILACNDIKDITPLACQTDLEYLEIFINKLTDLSPLAALKNLRDLNISFNPDITDVTALYDLPNLERLWLTMDKAVPQEQIDHLRELYPDTEIVVRSNGATGDILLDDDKTAPGWRQHPHYPVIYHMFNHGEFVDWDWDLTTCPLCLKRFGEGFGVY